MTLWKYVQALIESDKDAEPPLKDLVEIKEEVTTFGQLAVGDTFISGDHEYVKVNSTTARLVFQLYSSTKH